MNEKQYLFEFKGKTLIDLKIIDLIQEMKFVDFALTRRGSQVRVLFRLPEKQRGIGSLRFPFFIDGIGVIRFQVYFQATGFSETLPQTIAFLHRGVLTSDLPEKTRHGLEAFAGRWKYGGSDRVKPP